MKALTLVLACVCAPAGAQTIGLHLGSMHMPQKDQTNFNPGLYYRSDDGWTIGALQNSKARLGVYGGFDLQSDRFGLLVGAIYGYQRKRYNCVEASHGPNQPVTVCNTTDGSKTAIIPLLSPSVKTNPIMGFTPRISYIPRIGAGTSHTLHLSVEAKF